LTELGFVRKLPTKRIHKIDSRSQSSLIVIVGPTGTGKRSSISAACYTVIIILLFAFFLFFTFLFFFTDVSRRGIGPLR
jgi:hypothetical protein